MRLILGFDKRDYYKLKAEVERLEERIGNLEELNNDLRSLASKQAVLIESLKSELGQAHNAVEALVAEVDFLRQKLEELEAWRRKQESVRESVGGGGEEAGDPGIELLEPSGDEDEESERIVLEAIKSGVTSPSEIISVTGLSKHRVYAVLKKLSDEGLLEKKRDGRKVHYLLAVPTPH